MCHGCDRKMRRFSRDQSADDLRNVGRRCPRSRRAIIECRSGPARIGAAASAFGSAGRAAPARCGHDRSRSTSSRSRSCRSWSWRAVAERLRARRPARRGARPAARRRAGRTSRDTRRTLSRARTRPRSRAAPSAASRRSPWSDAAYPAALTTIVDPPPVLWMRGSRAALERAGGRDRRIARGVAVRARRWPSGSRPISPRAASSIVSGLARGVDSAAHRGALSAGGVDGRACSGRGADVVYPPEHAALARDDRAGRARSSASSCRARRRCRSSFRCATGSSAGCRARSSSSRRARRAGR